MYHEQPGFLPKQASERIRITHIESGQRIFCEDTLHQTYSDVTSCHTWETAETIQSLRNRVTQRLIGRIPCRLVQAASATSRVKLRVCSINNTIQCNAIQYYIYIHMLHMYMDYKLYSSVLLLHILQYNIYNDIYIKYIYI